MYVFGCPDRYPLGTVCMRRIIEFEVKLLLVAVMKFLARLPLPGNGKETKAR
ncbi:hypothetical protein M5D96_010518, partial [Drosophila gunungcola]